MRGYLWQLDQGEECLAPDRGRGLRRRVGIQMLRGNTGILSSGDQFDLVLCGLLETLEEDFFKRMRQQFPDIPMVVLSACHDLQLFLPALRDGAYDYLIKPFERDQLLFSVRRALEYRQLRLENRAYARLLL